MSQKEQNAKHSVDKGAQREKYNANGEASYVENPEQSKSTSKSDEGKYLEGKWKKISSEFRAKYKIPLKDSEFKNKSFSVIAEKLEKQTGKTRTEIEEEIKNWQNS